MKGLGDGIVPDAWLGHYVSTSFRTACALFGCGKENEGYEWLEKAFEAYPKWDNIPDGTEMEVGDPLIYSGVFERNRFACSSAPDAVDVGKYHD